MPSPATHRYYSRKLLQNRLGKEAGGAEVARGDGVEGGHLVGHLHSSDQLGDGGVKNTKDVLALHRYSYEEVRVGY